MIDFPLVSLLTAVAATVIAVPLVWFVAHAPRVPQGLTLMVTFVVLALCVGGIAGAVGRVLLIERSNPEMDRILRIMIIALRVFSLGGMAYVIWKLWQPMKESRQ